MIQASDRSIVLSSNSLSCVSLDHYHLTKGVDPSWHYPYILEVFTVPFMGVFLISSLVFFCGILSLMSLDVCISER